MHHPFVWLSPIFQPNILTRFMVFSLMWPPNRDRTGLKEVLFTSRQHLADKDLDRLTNFVFAAPSAVALHATRYAPRAEQREMEERFRSFSGSSTNPSQRVVPSHREPSPRPEEKDPRYPNGPRHLGRTSACVMKRFIGPAGKLESHCRFSRHDLQDLSVIHALSTILVRMPSESLLRTNRSTDRPILTMRWIGPLGRRRRRLTV